MKIVMVGPFAPPGEKPGGGVEAVADVMVRELPRLGVDLTYIAAAADLDAEQMIGPAKIIHLKRVARPGFLTYWNLDAVRVARLIDKLKPDLVHWQGNCGFNQYANEPGVVTIHGIPSGDQAVKAADAWHWRVTATARIKLIDAVEKRARTKIGRAIVINDYVIEALPDVANLDPVQIPNPIDERMLSLPAQTAREPATILMSAAINFNKQQLLAIQMIAAMAAKRKDAKLLLAGPVHEPDYDVLCRAFVAQHGLGDRVEFLGHLDRPGLIAAYDRASLVLLCSLRENAPMVVAEGNARGAPALGPADFGLKYMIKNGVNGAFLPPAAAGVEAAANAALAALECPWDRAAISAQARADYAPSQIGARTVAHYAHLAGRAA
ncbi:MAG: glycosyltransferase family 4 protein [Caulobacterales bacterium]|jgi:glycosyltransferase involved in cell wall biosynthesis